MGDVLIWTDAIWKYDGSWSESQVFIVIYIYIYMCVCVCISIVYFSSKLLFQQVLLKTIGLSFLWSYFIFSQAFLLFCVCACYWKVALKAAPKHILSIDHLQGDIFSRYCLFMFSLGAKFILLEGFIIGAGEQDLGQLLYQLDPDTEKIRKKAWTSQISLTNFHLLVKMSSIFCIKRYYPWNNKPYHYWWGSKNN